MNAAPGDFSPGARRHRELTSSYVRLSCVLDPPPFEALGGPEAGGAVSATSAGATSGGLTALAGGSNDGGGGGNANRNNSGSSSSSSSSHAESMEALARADAENSEETEALLLRARKWTAELKELRRVPAGRVFETTATSLEGTLVFLPRFLRPEGVEPPPKEFFPRGDGDNGGGGGGGGGDDSFARSGGGRKGRRGRRNVSGGDDDSASSSSASNVGEKRVGGNGDDGAYDPVAEAARFVSLVPFLEDFRAFRNLDLWCTSSQFLEVLAGDYEEHAILLWHYLTWLQLHGHMQTSKRGSRHERNQASDGSGGNTTTGDNTANAAPDSSSSTGAPLLRWTFYLLLGRAIPEGSTVMVLQYDSASGEAVVWDACRGEACDARDPRLGLVDVGCLVGPDNLWANVQREGKPADMVRRGRGFDVTDPSKWKPFFPGTASTTAASSSSSAAAASFASSPSSFLTAATTAAGTTAAAATTDAAEKRREVLAGGLPCVQQRKLAYAPPLPVEECNDLAQRIQDRLRDAITVWRTTKNSPANNSGGGSGGGGRSSSSQSAAGGGDHRAYPVFAPDTRAKILLRQLEPRKLGQLRSSALPPPSALSASSSGGGGGVDGGGGGGGLASSLSSSLNGGLGQSVGDLLKDNSQRDVFGVTLNFTFTDMETIEERLKSTAIHETAAADVLFLLAVHVVPFPCKVLSVWVFYGSMPRKSAH